MSNRRRPKGLSPAAVMAVLVATVAQHLGDDPLCDGGHPYAVRLGRELKAGLDSFTLGLCTHVAAEDAAVDDVSYWTPGSDRLECVSCATSRLIERCTTCRRADVALRPVVVRVDTVVIAAVIDSAGEVPAVASRQP